MEVPGLLIRNPIGAHQIGRALAHLELGADDEVLDIGCGSGEILAQVLEGCACHGVGLDPDRGAIARARRRLQTVAGRWELYGFPLEDMQPSPGRFTAVMCIGATHAFALGEEAWPSALRGMSERARPGGWLLVGDGYWRQTPAEEYLQATGLQRTEMRGHGENIAVAEALGLKLVVAETTTQDDFDVYERCFWQAAEDHLEARPKDPEMQVQAQHWRDWSDAYQRWGRDTLGFGLYLFRMP